MRNSSQISRFNLGGRDFYIYQAQDSHGSGCETLMVDGKMLDSMEMRKVIVDSLGLGAAVVRNRLNQIYLYGVCEEIRLKDIEFQIEGVTFYCFMYPIIRGEAIPAHVYKVNGLAVGSADFSKAICDALGDSKRWLSWAMSHLKPDFIHAMDVQISSE